MIVLVYVIYYLLVILFFLFFIEELREEEVMDRNYRDEVICRHNTNVLDVLQSVNVVTKMRDELGIRSDRSHLTDLRSLSEANVPDCRKERGRSSLSPQVV